MMKKPGITLVELLVVLTVIGILLLISIPALQTLRESARRSSCSAQLRQIGLGIQAYHTANERFPVGGLEWRPFGNTTHRQLAWSAFLLPYIEQRNVFEQIDFQQAFDSPANQLAASQFINTYICPSGSRGRNLVDGRGPADFGGIFGERISGPNHPPKGTMLYDVWLSITDVIDGQSNTLIVAEDTGWPDGQWINGKNIFDQAFGINQAPSFENDIRSEHPGGAHVCFVDAHVVFVPDHLDTKVLAAICTRSGREIISQIIE